MSGGMRCKAARARAAADVGSLRVAAMIREQAFGLHVAVNNVFAMAINRSTSELLDVKGRSVLWKTHRLFQMAVQFALGGEFKNEIKTSGVVEVPVESKIIWMPKMTLNLNLAPQLVLHAVIVQLRLEQHLEGDNVPA